MTTRRAILTALDRVHPYLLPEPALWSDVCGLLPHAVTITDLRQAATDLESTRQIACTTSEEGVVKYRITDNGRLALQA
jgi:hypothetical protein